MGSREFREGVGFFFMGEVEVEVVRGVYGFMGRRRSFRKILVFFVGRFRVAYRF